MSQKLILLDGNSLLFRSFYALPLLHTREGEYTNAVYGFLLMLKKLIKEENPTHIAVALDKKRRSFRNEIFADYKGTRKDTPDELIPQFALIREVLKKHELPFIEIDDYEADDIIGTLSSAADLKGLECVIVSGDRDVLQLVTDTTTVIFNKKGITDTERYDSAKVLEKMGVRVDQIVDLKALMGDSSDNIPGVTGVGPKTAVKLLQTYDTLEGIFAHLGDLKGKLRENLENNREIAFMSRTLGTIVRNVPIPVELDGFIRKEPDLEEVIQLYRRLEFKQFLTEAQKSAGVLENSKQQPAPSSKGQAGESPSLPPVTEKLQGNLFDEASVVRIESFKAWKNFLRYHAKTAGFGVYFEPENRHPMWNEVENIWVAAGQTAACIPVGKIEEGYQWIKDFLQAEKPDKYFFNSKFCRVAARRKDIMLSGVKGDLMLLTYVINPAFTGETLLESLEYHRQTDNEGMAVAEQVTYLVPLSQMLYRELSAELKTLLDTMEFPAAEILAEMEYAGIRVDREVLAGLHDELTERVQDAKQKVYTLAGQVFNINSPKQLGVVLFEELGLPVVKKTKSGYATGAEILEQLAENHEIIRYIMLYRQLTKLKSTYIDALPQMIHPVTGRVHTVFKQAMTATGRLSSVEPNLQNIPIRMEEGRRIRKAFMGRDDSYLLLSADYSQIDLRVLAHISEDENLIATFRQGLDVHTRTAAEIFHVELNQVTEDMRRRAKAVNFGIVYGISPFGLSRDIGVSQSEAKQYIEKYLDSYPGVRRYMEEVVNEGGRKGYVETIFNRRRYLPDLNAGNKMLQSLAKRMALNTPVQGTSADIIKLAMIDIGGYLRQSELSARMLLQVHDELVFEVQPDKLHELAALVKTRMEQADLLKVPLLISLKAGTDWYDMKPLEL